MSMLGVSANRLEILQIARAVAEEKSIDKAIVIEAMEEAIEKAAKSKYGLELDIRAKIDIESGEQTLWRVITVIPDERQGVDEDSEDLEMEMARMPLSEARKIKPDVEIGEEITEELPPFDFGRSAAQSAKHVILQKVREAERQRHYDEYKDRVGEVINGIVKRVEYGNIIVDLGRAEGIIRRNDAIPRENFQPNDRVRCYLYKCEREQRGPQIFLSRAHPDFMVRLFAQEVPEIYDGVIEIRTCARDPGSRAKIGVFSNDPSIDPVGACVGMGGSRVKAVVSELMGEKVDIIPWSNDEAAFIVNALQPAEVSKVVLDEDERRVEVVVADDQFPLAIGRRGQNVRLATNLTGWQIDLMTETDDNERFQKEFEARTALFVSALDVDETLAQYLASEGFESVEDIAYVSTEELLNVGGFDQDVAEEIQQRAIEHIEKLNAELEAKRMELGVADAVAALDEITPALAVRFGENDVKTIEDIAGLVPDDITGWREPGPDGKPVLQPGIFPKGEMSNKDAQVFIMRARLAVDWITQEDFDALLQDQAVEALAAELELSDEDRALMAFDALGTNSDDDTELDEEALMSLDLERLGGGDDDAQGPR